MHAANQSRDHVVRGQSARNNVVITLHSACTKSVPGAPAKIPKPLKQKTLSLCRSRKTLAMAMHTTWS